MRLRLATLLLAAAWTAPALAQSAEAELRHGMAAMQHDMGGMKMTGDADRDFVAMMIPHHQGAIDMARVELKHGKDPALRKLAEAIIKAQDAEIEMMTRWQRQHAK